MKVAVFGLGYVGSVVAGCLASEGHVVMGVDVSPEKVAAVNKGTSPVREPGLDALFHEGCQAGRLTASCDGNAAVRRCEACIVCVGTPSNAAGEADLSHVADVCRRIGSELAEVDGYRTVILRSTVPPGATRRVAIRVLEAASGLVSGVDFGCVFQPEFLREGSAIGDYYDPPLSVAGGAGERDMPVLEQLMGARWSATRRVPLEVAELVKYASNAFHALKVAFANEIGAIARQAGTDGRRVMSVLCDDRKLNISSSYLVPGFAFGGSCLPKDLRALEAMAGGFGVDAPLVEAIRIANEAHIARAVGLVARLGEKIGIAGAAFKSGTDDLRESPALKLAAELVGVGKSVRILEPQIDVSSLAGANKQFALGLLPALEAMLVDDFEQLDRLSDVVVVARMQVATVEQLLEVLARKPVVDLVGALYGRTGAEENYFALAW